MDRDIRPFGPEELGEVLIGGMPSPVLEIVLREGDPGSDFEALPDPFFRIEDCGGVGYLYLCRLRGAGLPDRAVVLKVEKDGCSAEHTGSTAEALGRDPSELFHEHYRVLSTLGRDPRFPVVGVVHAPLAGAEGSGLQRLPPLFFCKHRRVFFRPPCPRCGRPLEDCTDEKLLAASGLLPLRETGRRYLYCPDCGRGPEARFYACAVDERDGAAAGDRWELVRSYAALTGSGVEAQDPTFPCLCCASSGTCYAGGGGEGENEALRLLVPFAFHAFHAFVHDFLPLRFDECADLLGGVSREALAARLAEQRESERLALVGGEMSADGGGFLFGREGRERLGLEALWLKLGLFETLCRGVGAVHQELRRPHLNLRPASVWAGFGPRKGSVPTFWNFEVLVAGVDGARPLAGAGESDGAVLQPPAAYELAYAHPAVADNLSGQFAGGRLSVLDLEQVAEPAGAWAVRGRLASPARNLGAGPAEDRLEVRLGRSQGFRQDFSLMLQVTGRDGEGVLVRSEPAPLDGRDADQLRVLQSLPYVEVKFRLWHRFGPECDLYGLGMLLFRALLGGEDPGKALERCREAVSRLGRLAGAPEEQVVRELDRELAATPFMPHGEAPGGEGPGSVPEALWRRALALGFRLTTELPGFSYWSGSGSGGDPWGVLEVVARDLGSLRADVHRALFLEPPGLETDVRVLLEDLIADPGWLERVLTPSARAPEAPAGRPAARPVPPEPGPGAPEPGLETTEVLRPAAEGSGLETTEVPRTRPAAGRPPPEPVPPAPSAEESLDSTVILRPGQIPREREAPAPEPSAAGLEPTVVLGGPGGPPAAAEPPAPAPAPEPDLDSTVILRPGAPDPGSQAPAGEEAHDRGEEEDSLDSTVILKPGKLPLGKK